jgi:hypothetical protein
VLPALSLATALEVRWPSGGSVQDVRITSSFTSLWPPDPKWCSQPHATCEQRGDLLERTRSYEFTGGARSFVGDAMPVEQDAIDAITSEMRRPASIPTPKLLGLDSGAIETLGCKPGTSAQAILLHYFDQRYFVTDAYPEITVVFLLSGGKTVELHAETQALYALPWTIAFDSIVYRSYNPKISTALAHLLPTDDLNHDFLAGGSAPVGAATFAFGCR